MKKTLFFAGVLHILCSGMVADTYNYELQTIGSVEFTGEDSVLEEHLKTFGVRANKRLSHNWMAGLGYMKTNNAKFENISAKTDIDRYFINAFYEIDSNKEYTPYLITGLGYQDFERELQNAKSGIVAQAGIGFKTDITQHLQFLLEGKFLRDFENATNDFIVSAGLSIPFGYEPKSAPKPIVKPEDSDKDGVVDSDDLCPNTPFGIKVGPDGCPPDSDKDGVYDYKDRCPATPVGVEVDENGCCLDSDNDGVVDFKDKCPNTPKGAKVDENGCCVDSDNDGVPDFKDKCLDTPEGFDVDQQGCPIVYNFMINFDFNSAKIKSKYLSKIEEFAEFMKENRTYKAEIQGHTDNKGSNRYNKKLSLQRAKSVYDMLIKFGVEADRLTYVGYGEEKPIASNDTESGRAKNRRVEAQLFTK
ncbi:OmpA family protein [Nitrosophilus labii]|uniref:OmpA family protein n=1 Tax=Nitrosophilus labii TaxID=2706014 RepID=UPI001656F8DA|nr:OmpA family protein [Nitrosophilus labii]